MNNQNLPDSRYLKTKQKREKKYEYADDDTVTKQESYR